MSTEVRITDPDTGGQKGQKDERFDLIPWDALEEVARVYGWGAKKYADDNWLKGYRWRLSAGALVRHVARWMLGEDRDRESGLHHLAHAAWHCLTLITFAMRGLGTDDRAKRTLNLIEEPAPKGKLVRCVDDSDSAGLLKYDHRYVVIEEAEDYYYLQGIAGGWGKSRFGVVS